MKEHKLELLNVLNGLASHIAVLDENGTIVLVNKAWREFAEQNGGLVNIISEGANYLTVCHTATGDGSEGAKEFTKGIQRVLSGEGDFFSWEYPCHAPNQERWFVGRVTPIIQNGSRYAIVVHDNITTRKHAEQNLQESEQRYRTVLTAMAEGVVLHQASGEIVYANKAAEEILGLTFGQMTGRTSMDPRWHAIHEDGEPFPGENHPAMVSLRTGEAVRNVIMGVHKPTGELTWISVNSEPVLHTNTLLPSGVVATFHDITELTQADLALRESEKRLHGIIDSAMDAIVAIDEAQNIVLFNPMAERVFGYSMNEMLGQPLIYLIPKLYRHKHEIYVKNFGETGVTERKMKAGLVYGLRADGSEFPLEASISKLTVNGRRLYTAILRDVSEQKKLEEQFYQAQKMETIGQLAGGIAHDFNNLLTPLMMYTHMGKMNVSEDEELYQYLQEIENIAERAKRLTQQILSLSRKYVLAIEKIQINDIVLETGKLLQRVIPEHIQLVFTLGEQLPFIQADVNQLEQILMNLAINARDAMPNGGVLTIKTEFVTMIDDLLGFPEGVPSGNYVVLSVQDMGVGIDKTTQKHLFEPFYTTKGKGEGTGLGLPTVQTIVKRHQGYIQFLTQLGQGTEFQIYLPSLLETDKVMKEKEQHILEEIVSGTGTILVVEDEERVRLPLLEMLNLQGYQVLDATNGTEALQVAASYDGEIHLLLTDIMMPDMNGPELQRKLQVTYPAIKVLYMSGYSGDIIERLTLTKDVDFLSKPFSIRGLNQKIQDILN